MSTHDESQQKQHKKQKHHKFQFDFSTTEDLFISTKGRELRNKQKKLDKVTALEKQIKKGELQPNDTQKEMIQNKDAFLITRVVGSPHHIAVVGGEEWNSISSLVNAASALKDHEINRSFDKSKWSTQA